MSSDAQAKTPWSYAALWTDLRRNRVDSDLTDVKYIAGEVDHVLALQSSYPCERHVMSPTNSRLRIIPASFFGMPLGLLALGIAWRSAAGIWPVPLEIGEVLIWAGALLWAFLFIVYLAKWVWQRVAAEAYIFAAGNLVIAAIAVVTVMAALCNELLPTPLPPHS
jgi:hypothetical protein